MNKKFEKNLTKPKKLTGGTLRDFSTSIQSQIIKIEGGTLWGSFSKKSRTMPKKVQKGGPFSLAR